MACPHHLARPGQGRGHRGCGDSDDVPNMQELFGAPHTGAAPCLFADGGVRNLGYDIDALVVAELWAYNDGHVVPQDF